MNVDSLLKSSASMMKVAKGLVNPRQRIFIFKIDFARWYRLFLLDPVSAIFFAIRWCGKIYLYMVLSFGNRAAALAAQRYIWAIVQFFPNTKSTFSRVFQQRSHLYL